MKQNKQLVYDMTVLLLFSKFTQVRQELVKLLKTFIHRFL